MARFSLLKGLNGVLAALLYEVGIITLWRSTADAKLLCAQRFVRMFAYGGSTLILASYLSALDISDSRIGMFMTLTLVGDGIISFFLAVFADALGRRAVLALGSLLMVASGVAFGLTSNYVILLAAAVFGVISPSGNETGPFRAVEESTLADVTSPEQLCDMIVWYSLLGNLGAAAGMATCGWAINLLQSVNGWGFIASCRMVYLGYAAIGGLKFALSLCLSGKVEARQNKTAPCVEQQEPQDVTERRPLLNNNSGNERRRSADSSPKRMFAFPSLDKELMVVFVRLSVLFGLDAFASGLASPSWMAYFFKHKFSLSEGQLGTIFSTTTIVAAGSMLVATSTAKRIGNVKTMVLAHLVASLWLIFIPIPSGLFLALSFLALRSCSQNMDVAPRGAFIATIIPSDKRTAIMGALNVVKTYSQCFGPLATGVMANRGMLGWSFTTAGIIKVVYNIGILVSFGATGI
ncbi:Major facilitator superfamily domain, general substrate transporter [Metarhizium rileyi]|uniref:Major facilitator superfamily domain, general substrate transporter n=1 Tax=Metarhizium rileyi (strain RCEF 4871) TaxID=1649241 RepID=A0A167A514_METRR|nr:Major facilitator superfamily domain, general substrate transporter [Metarhizium rileyi RCEF 4871]